MEPIELAVARGKALEFLHVWLDRDRAVNVTDRTSYMVDDLLLQLMARHGFPMTRQELNGSVMSYLRGAGLAEFSAEQPAGPKGPTIVGWRITHDGMQVMEGTRTDPGVKVA